MRDDWAKGLARVMSYLCAELLNYLHARPLSVQGFLSFCPVCFLSATSQALLTGSEGCYSAGILLLTFPLRSSGSPGRHPMQSLDLCF